MKEYYNMLYLYFRNKFIAYSAVAIILSSIIGSIAIMLSLMKKNNLISFSGKKIKLLDREKLQQISDPFL